MDSIEQVTEVFDRQKAGYATDRDVPFETRLARLDKVGALLRDNYRALLDAVREDYGSRDDSMGFLGDIWLPLDHLAHVRRRLKRWMRPEPAGDGFYRLLGQRTQTHYEPLGVVGIITPFNLPVGLALDPAIDALAAGNTVMIRLPESLPRTGALMAELAAKYFAPEELAVVTGDLELGKAFAALPWDKLVFTGGTGTARHILAAAAPNLTPVLLELGGKSPVVVLEDADLQAVADKTVRARLLNGGQICICSDYVLVPEGRVDEFVGLIQAETETLYPKMLDNPGYTAVVDEAAYRRITGYVAQARDSGARVIEVNPGGEALPDPASRKIPLTIVVDPGPDLDVSRHEIFGPVLPVIGYKLLDDAIAVINGGEKPLALYIHGRDRGSIDHILAQTSSGGVTVNDYLLHAAAPGLGFGGVGHSGTGRYKGGKQGFRSFSNPKSVYRQGWAGRFTKDFMPPFTPRAKRLFKWRVGLK